MITYQQLSRAVHEYEVAKERYWDDLAELALELTDRLEDSLQLEHKECSINGQTAKYVEVGEVVNGQFQSKNLFQLRRQEDLRLVFTIKLAVSLAPNTFPDLLCCQQVSIKKSAGLAEIVILGFSKESRFTVEIQDGDGKFDVIVEAIKQRLVDQFSVAVFK
ncbi:hypothetical protein PWG14_25005 [Chromobacterium amazonense]|uniref:hypothetical protein n=1 Tax=Chromobacterium amazonense TaxID=1382803 RepID=UPI00237E7F21|nr:hypothetical protein [Chromobacterium amazonense]MDE1715729.1 hypothetical protein [Chromobacterium amazonense]